MVNSLRSEYGQLLFFSIPKLLHLYQNLVGGRPSVSRIVNDVSILFQNKHEVQRKLRHTIKVCMWGRGLGVRGVVWIRNFRVCGLNRDRHGLGPGCGLGYGACIKGGKPAGVWFYGCVFYMGISVIGTIHVTCMRHVRTYVTVMPFRRT